MNDNENITLLQKFRGLKAEKLFARAKMEKGQGNNRKALNCLRKAAKIFKNLPKHKIIYTVVLNNIGDTYFNLNRFTEASEYFHQAEQFYETEHIDSETLIRRIRRNLALCYKTMHKPKEFISYAEKTIKSETDAALIAEMFIDLSYAYRLLEDYERALSCSNEALAKYEAVSGPDSLEAGRSRLSIALVHLEVSQFALAIHELEIAEHIYEQNSAMAESKKGLYELMSIAYEGLGYHDTARYYSGKGRGLEEKTA